MMKKEMLFILLAIGCLANNVQCDDIPGDDVFARTGEQIYAKPKENKEPQVCNKRRVNGNDVWNFIYLGGCQKNPSPEFGKTTVVKLKKGGKYDTQFQLKEVRKGLDKGPRGRTRKDDQKLSQWDALLREFEAENVIECPDLIQLLNKDDELKDVTVVIYGTQNIKHCELYKEFLEQQKQQKYNEEMVDLQGQC